MQQYTDVVIVGAGASGLAAAVSAHDAGASVRIIDKGPSVGGTAAISGGVIWVANNAHMAAAGLEDDREAALAYFRSLSDDLDGAVLEAFVDEGPAAIAFLEQATPLRLAMLAGYPDYYLDRPGARPGGGRALDCDLFDFTTLGAWRDKVLTGADVSRLMLRETPLGAPRPCPPRRCSPSARPGTSAVSARRWSARCWRPAWHAASSRFWAPRPGG